MNNKTISTNLLLLILSGVVAVLLVVLIVLRYNHLSETNQAIETETRILEDNKARLARLKKLEKIQPQLEQAVAALNLQIPQAPQEYKIIEQVQKLSSENAMNFIQIQFSDRTKSNSLTEMPLKLKFNGKYPSLVKLLNNLAKGERLIRIDEIVISKAEGASDGIYADITAFAFSK